MPLALLLTLALLSLLLLTHDLVPLGRWNNLAATNPAVTNPTVTNPHRPLPTRIAFTLLNSLTGLIPTWLAFRSLHTTGLTPARRIILIVLAILLLGELTSWWIPWAFNIRLSASRRQHLALTSAGTYSLVPERHGIRPNALHTVIHLLTLLALAELLLILR